MNNLNNIGNGRSINLIGLSVEQHAAPLAHPVVVQAKTGAGVELHVFGGLSPLQLAAITIVGQIGHRFEEEDAAAKAVSLAVATLAECERVEKEMGG